MESFQQNSRQSISVVDDIVARFPRKLHSMFSGVIEIINFGTGDLV